MLVIVVSSGIAVTCLSASIAAAICGGDSFSARGFAALTAARLTFDFVFFDAARFATVLRDALAFCFPRFELFLLADARFFVLAMAVSCEMPASKQLDGRNPSRHYFAAIRHVI